MASRVAWAAALDVNLIMNKPLRTNDMDLIFQVITGQSTASSERDEYLQDLLEKYRRSIYDKIEMLESLIEKYTEHQDRGSLSELSQEMHKIAGSAGNYGYTHVSRIAGNFNKYLKGILEKKALNSAEVSSDLELFLKDIKIGFQTTSDSASHDTYDMLVIDRNNRLLKELKHAGLENGLNILVESNREIACKLLSNPQFHCRILLCGQSKEWSCFDLIRIYNKHHDRKRTAKGIILDSMDRKHHDRANKEGIEHILSRPVSVRSLLHLCYSSETLKILLVTPDAHTKRLLQEATAGTGAETRVVREHMDIPYNLEMHNPDIVLIQTMEHTEKALKTTFEYMEIYPGNPKIVAIADEATETEIRKRYPSCDVIRSPVEKIALWETIKSLD